MSLQLFDNALLLEGEIANPVDMSKRIYEIMKQTLELKLSK